MTDVRRRRFTELVMRMTDTTPWAPDVVLMPVPLSIAPRVAAYIASLRGVVSAEESNTETVQVPGQGPWTRAQLQVLHDQMPYAGVIALLDRCALAFGWVPKNEVEEQLGISAIQLRNELGAFSKLSKRLFGDAIWPMEWKKEKGVYYYRLDRSIASWWREMRGVER